LTALALLAEREHDVSGRGVIAEDEKEFDVLEFVLQESFQDGQGIGEFVGSGEIRGPIAVGKEGVSGRVADDAVEFQFGFVVEKERRFTLPVVGVVRARGSHSGEYGSS